MIGHLYFRGLGEVMSMDDAMIDSLPYIIHETRSRALKQVLLDKLEKSFLHKERLQRLFLIHDYIPEGIANDNFVAQLDLLKERLHGEKQYDEDIASLLHSLSHTEVSTYHMLADWAEMMREDIDADLLHQSLEEEEEFDNRLASLELRMTRDDAKQALAH